MLQRATFILLDAARMGVHLHEAKVRNRTSDCLYRGESESTLAGVGPHIFQFAYPTPFSTWCLKMGWGDSWGILLKSSWPLTELHKHFRKFLLVKTEDGQELYFRFYDPRVLRIFLPTCDAAQIREFFGGAVDYFIVEDEDPEFALQFYHQNGILQTERFSVKDVLAALPAPEPLPPPPDDPLPPETIAALQAQGIDPSTLALGPTLAEVEKPEAEETPAFHPPTLDSTPTATTPKPKTKWKMFE